MGLRLKGNDKQDSHKSFNTMDDFFFRTTVIFICILCIIGFLSSLYIIIFYPENIFKGIALLFTTIWGTLFLSYFRWAIFYYNINYGKSKAFWDQVFKERQKRIEGNPLDKTEIEAPKENPYKNQTFGFPPGTVRGMIAFTLLFGAISLLIASFGMNGEIDQSSFYWDHFEFFKTAFLMMIAFYFGSHSLKYLQKNPVKQRSGNQQSDDTEDTEPETETSTIDKTKPFDMKVPENISSVKKILNTSELPKAGKGLIPIIDAGHGGIIDGKYTSGEKKKYTFLNDDGTEDFTIYEGVVNRQIGEKLIDILDSKGIPYKDLTVSDKQDMPLKERISRTNKIFDQNNKYYLLSIHSNAVSGDLKGKGSKASGFEVYTSKGQTKSDDLATIAAKWYKKCLHNFRFRQEIEDGDPDKEANYAVLRDTKCPAFLVENLFFDNKTEAKYLMSENGQNEIANCLYNIIDEIYYEKKA